MDELLDAIAALVSLISKEKIQAVSARLRRLDGGSPVSDLSSVVGTPAAQAVVEHLAHAWKNSKIGADEEASMLIAASHVYNKAVSEQSTELVWTGPTTPFVSARRTEQALLQVINSAQQSLFITSFVAYDVASIVTAMNVANERGVRISLLLELSQDQGGSISFDAMGKMRVLIPSANLYAWKHKKDDFSNGSVHAKVAVADAKLCFITSANLTGHAMEKNMEAGVLISGGRIPCLLDSHLNSLVDMNLISKFL